MTHASHFDGDTLTLTSPRGTLVLSQGQCASIVIMAEKHGPVGRVREAHRPAAQGDEAAYDKLRAWSVGYEYYYDAYFGPDAPFGNQQPTAATLAKVLQNGARLVPLVMMAKDAELASLREQLAELTRENADQRSTIEEEQINARSLVAERDRALDELAAEREKLSEATKNLHKWIELANANACLETSKGEAHRLFEENKTLRNDLAAMTERAEKAEADLAAERLKPKQHHNECLFCGTRFSALQVELDALKARKVKLPPSRVPLTDPQGHGDPYANGYSWGLLDCAAAIRAAGVEVEG